MSRVKNKPFFRNPEGTLIRIKALLEATRVREGLEEAEKLADQRLSSKNAFRLEKILKEKIRIDGGSFVTELSAYPNLRKLVGVESDISSQTGPISSRDFDTTMFQNTQPELVACAILPLSGSIGSIGSRVAEGLSLAFELANSRNLVLHIRDVGSSAQEFEPNFNLLSRETTCSFYIGPFVYEQIEVFNNLNSDKKFAVFLARKPTKSSFDFIHLGLTNRSQILSMLKFINDNSFNRVGIIKAPSTFSHDFCSEFETVTSSYNGSINLVFKTLILEGFDEISLQKFERELNSFKPDAVVAPLNISEFADLFIGLSDKTKSSSQFIGTALLDDETALAQFFNQFQGIVYPVFFDKDATRDRVKVFLDGMTQKNMLSSIDVFSALGFEVGELLIQTLQDCGWINSDCLAKVALSRQGLLGEYVPNYLPSLERILTVKKIS